VPAPAEAKLVAEGLLERVGPRIRLAEPGFPVADAIVRHLADRLAVEPRMD
jgi:hypothetical protein